MKKLLAFFKHNYGPKLTAQGVAELQLTQAKLDYLTLRHAEEDHRSSAAACAAQADEVSNRIDRLTAYLEQAQ